MSYHSRMMNVQDELEKSYLDADKGSPVRRAYLYGHRDARHACAEIALEADERIERIEDELARLYRLCAEIESNKQDNPLAAPVAQWMREVATRFSRALQESEA